MLKYFHYGKNLNRKTSEQLCSTKMFTCFVTVLHAALNLTVFKIISLIPA